LQHVAQVFITVFGAGNLRLMGTKVTDSGVPVIMVWPSGVKPLLAVARKRRPWFEGLWANAGQPVRLTPEPSNS
jgi:hypothetical protein